MSWRFQLYRGSLEVPPPPELQGLKGVKNLLKYMAVVITFWLDSYLGLVEKWDCYLETSDNSSAVGWLYKHSFS